MSLSDGCCSGMSAELSLRRRKEGGEGSGEQERLWGRRGKPLRRREDGRGHCCGEGGFRVPRRRCPQ